MKFIFFSALLLTFSISLRAQTLEGQILDQSSSPIAEATVINRANQQHSHSDLRGNFQLEKVAVGDTLEFRHLLYRPQLLLVVQTDSPIIVKLDDLAVELEEVVINNKVNSLQLLSDIDLQLQPVKSSQDLLKKVPGLFIGQHAGGGKAEQIFLRGFDIDHGTDLSITVDDMPVNMVSHAHGQGYADLHFLIPETVEQIQFEKGSYNEQKGNFATAGYVNFKTKNYLENNLIKLEAGQYNSARVLGLFKLFNSEKQSAYIASDYQATDGYFESPQHFDRLNLFAKYSLNSSPNNQINITASHFQSSWDASGQIPTRAVEQGLISRFGAIDDTEGGQTSRTNIRLAHKKIIDAHSLIKTSLYWSKYDFELYSNFTFFLEDSINGDQIKQQEDRNIYGLNTEYNRFFHFNQLEGALIAGLQLRADESIDNELSHTVNRQTVLEQIQFGDIQEKNAAAYLGAKLNIGKWLIQPSLRLDYFDFAYTNHLSSEYDHRATTKSILSPKLNIAYQQSNRLQLYLKGGKGFHSNDSRLVIAQNLDEILPATYGFDLGYNWKISPKMFLNMAYWYLYMEQEFVYVGDAGIVEPSGRSQRQGIDLSYRYQPIAPLFFNLDANYTHARSIEEEIGQDYIPLAADFTLQAGLNYKHPSGLYGSLNLRHINDRPANEDNSIVAEGYTLVDANLGYGYKQFDFAVQVQNLFNTAWNETQFATESRLFNESESVEEIHFTPGTPFFLKAVMQYKF
ncbi:outer membrane receptor protein [Saprospira grandis DSM 2844]|uniref:Outer membrane receptor protein n=1 Tax=Saprospira grandis DSM 2844 TaxID=694433 RepID=J0P436_9BACT|nr:TonB-dependent receptor [Saprospira grandis]EJF52167.1 outer membrane receptor protein [Saprospira grandis DSM 2844]